MEIKSHARAAGILILVSLVAGGFGEFYVPSVLISGGATGIAYNLHASPGLVRWGFAGYLVEALCDVGLTYVFFVMFRTVDRNLALLALLFRIMGTASYAIAEFFYYGGMLISEGDYLRSFTIDQRNSVLEFVMQWFAGGGELFTMFYGAGLIVLGILFYRSGYVPKILAASLGIGGAGFVIHNFTLVLAPSWSLAWLLAPAALALLLLGMWLLIRGVEA